MHLNFSGRSCVSSACVSSPCSTCGAIISWHTYSALNDFSSSSARHLIKIERREPNAIQRSHCFQLHLLSLWKWMAAAESSHILLHHDGVSLNASCDLCCCCLWLKALVGDLTNHIIHLTHYLWLPHCLCRGCCTSRSCGKVKLSPTTQSWWLPWDRTLAQGSVERQGLSSMSVDRQRGEERAGFQLWKHCRSSQMLPTHFYFIANNHSNKQVRVAAVRGVIWLVLSYLL